MGIHCHVCKTPLSGGLDTFGPNDEPECAACFNEYWLISGARNDAYEAMLSQEQTRFLPTQVGDVDDVEAGIGALTIRQLVSSQAIQAKEALSYFQEMRYWFDFNLAMSRAGLHRGVFY